MPENDWNAYKELFLHEMKENGKQFGNVARVLESLREEIATIKIDIEQLKVKAALAGGAAGLVCTAIVTVLLKLWS